MSAELKSFQSVINEFDEVDVANIKPQFELLTKRLSALERNAFNNEATVPNNVAVAGSLTPEVESIISKKIHSFVDSLSKVRSGFYYYLIFSKLLL